MNKLTPEHLDWRKKRARDYFKETNKHLSEDEYFLKVEHSFTTQAYLAGAEAEGEVMRLVGHLEVYGQQLYDAIEEDSIGIAYWRGKYEETEIAIAALLTKVEG